MTCPHLHWRIDPPNGNPLLRGTCRDCGAERTWPAAPNEKSWNRSAKAAQEREQEAMEGVR